MTRQEIRSKILSNIEMIKQLDVENVNLRREAYLISDDTQTFKEQTEIVTEKEGRKKIKVEKLIGRVYWEEEFTVIGDNDTPDKIKVQRSRIVKINGEWVV